VLRGRVGLAVVDAGFEVTQQGVELLLLALRQAAEQAKQAQPTEGEQTVNAEFKEVDDTDTK